MAEQHARLTSLVAVWLCPWHYRHGGVPFVGCGWVILESSHGGTRQAAGWSVLACVGIHANVLIHNLATAVRR
jgi:hypothetical protein